MRYKQAFLRNGNIKIYIINKIIKILTQRTETGHVVNVAVHVVKILFLL